MVVTLIADRDTIPERSLFLDKAHSVIPIGRASKVSAKGFVATQTNAWFQSAVMSRKHAELTADLEQKVKDRPTPSPSPAPHITDPVAEGLRAGHRFSPRNLYESQARQLKEYQVECE